MLFVFIRIMQFKDRLLVTERPRTESTAHAHKAQSAVCQVVPASFPTNRRMAR